MGSGKISISGCSMLGRSLEGVKADPFSFGA